MFLVKERNKRERNTVYSVSDQQNLKIYNTKIKLNEIKY